MLFLVISVLLLGATTAQSDICSSPNTVGRLYMDPGDCTYFYHCANGKDQRNYPCSAEEVFDPWRWVCVPNTEPINCTLNYNYFDQLCSNTAGGTVAYPDDCAKYLNCWDGNFIFPPMMCAHGTLYNEYEQRCDSTNDDNGRCGNRPFSSRTYNTEPCVHRPMPGDCNKYCDCRDKDDCRACGEGLYMSESKNICVDCLGLKPNEKEYCNLTC
ncbi:hypothetical protein SNE40_012149 [Patella caerulea]|uniref:Chitin-binding type-2 domain-containing protein n=1 Tax=Patella caerulea TaxID=87958 RepID=A0AAN8JQY8_PATCE